MSILKRCAAALLLCGLVQLAPVSASAQTLSREPPMGALKPGQRVLVDDGTCGRGRIKEVIGGDHVKVGGRNRVERRRRCIARR